MHRKNTLKRMVTLTASLLLSGCYHYEAHDGPPKYYRDVSKIPNAVPCYLPKSPYGNRSVYRVDGHVYHVLPTAVGYNENGIASWYGSLFDGRRTSTHERYNPYGMTAASTVLPIPCFVKVTNLENGRWIIVKVNDRGPFVPNRIMDLSYAGAVKLGYIGRGTALVNIKGINTEPGRVPYEETNPFATAFVPHSFMHHKQQPPKIYLQLGVFRSRYHAEHLRRLAASLTDKHTIIRAIRADTGAILYRVELGPLNDVQQADYIEYLFRQKHLGNPVTMIQ